MKRWGGELPQKKLKILVWHTKILQIESIFLGSNYFSEDFWVTNSNFEEPQC